MKLKRYLVRDKNNNPVALVCVYHFIKFNKLSKFKPNFINMLKKEQFDNLDRLIDDTLERLEQLIRCSENSIEKIKFQNKFSGLQDLKRKIYGAKKEYLENPSNQIKYNKLINLYNSSKNFL